MQLDQGWTLTFLSSILCISGCLVIYIENLYYLLLPQWITSRNKFHLKDNYQFLNGSMAFSSGCLIFTSLFRLLPESLSYFMNSDEVANDKWLNFCVIVSYAVGVAVCLLFNTILHLMTSESVVHCGHGTEPHGHSHDNQSHGSDYHEHQHQHQHEHGHENHFQNGHHHSHDSNINEESSPEHWDPSNDGHDHHDETSESTPLLIKKKSFLHFFVRDEGDVGECKGYSSAELCLFHTKDNTTEQTDLHFCEIPELNDSITTKSINHLHPTHSHDSGLHHHHHVTSPISRLFLIGIQTAFAVTLHKFPEGFITYVTSETNPQLGVTIFLSLLLHNFTEGFSICLPLYYSFANGVNRRYAKLKALAISAILVGLSQPLGALGGYIFLKLNHVNPGSDIDTSKLNFIFGITMAITSGFLTVVALSMYGSAISFGGSINFAMIWCMIGMVLIGLSSIYAV